MKDGEITEADFALYGNLSEQLGVQRALLAEREENKRKMTMSPKPVLALPRCEKYAVLLAAAVCVNMTN